MDSEHGESIVETIHKKGRHRKKQMYIEIRKLMEFYLSDSNIRKDRFFAGLLEENEYIDIEIFLNCNKIKKLTESAKDVVKALQKSEFLELNEDCTKVKRTKPIQEKINVEECTIYVQQISSDATHEWLMEIFSEFGKVEYVSIPKYKANKLNKGFAFIEFEQEEEAKRALDYFESIGCRISSQISPDVLTSIKNYVPESKENNSNNGKVDSKNDEAKKEVMDDKLPEKGRDAAEEIAKEKVDKSEKSKMPEKAKDNVSETMEEKVNDAGETVGEEMADKPEKRKLNDDSGIDEEGENASKKMKLDDSKDESEHKKKKKNKKKQQMKALGLQLLPKSEWRKLRNKYLNMQREKMNQLKSHLRKSRFNRYEEKMDQSDGNDNKEDIKKENKLEFIPGVIVKLLLPEPCIETKKLKTELKSQNPDIKYVEVPITLNSDQVFLRFDKSSSAKAFCDNFTKATCEILTGDEEASYWEQINNERIQKFNKSNKKQRGREKLLKKAERELGKHIRFDEPE